MSHTQREELWSLCFGDDLTLAHEFFSIPDIKVIEELRGTQLVGMASLVPVRCKDGTRGAYVYGVCTHPEHRGKGIFKKIMERCEQEALSDGCAFICLIPVNAGVARAYRKMGYSVEVSLCDACTENALSIYPDSESFRRYAESDTSELMSEPYGLMKLISHNTSPLSYRFSEPMGER